MSKLKAVKPKEISLTKGLVALVDADDYEALAIYSWYAHSGYAYRRMSLGKNKSKLIAMHRLVLNLSSGQYIDHINGIRTDNRKSNLRICTYAQNNFNQKLSKRNITGFKGITQHPKTKRWRAFLTYNYKVIHLGYFKEKLDAARAYDEAAIKYYGEFAKTNQMLGLIKGEVK